MVPIFNESGQKMVKYIRKAIGSEETATFEARALLNRYTCTNVASWAIGVDARSFEDNPSDLYKLSFSLFHFNPTKIIGLLLVMVCPALRSIIKIKYAV